MTDTTEYAAGTTFEFSECSVYVSNKEDSEELAIQARRLSQGTPDATIRLDQHQDRARSHTARIEFLALLRDRVKFEFKHSDTDLSNKTARIPAPIVAAGKAPCAAYLVTHGFSNQDIAELFNVSPRTISQYLTDFRKDQR